MTSDRSLEPCVVCGALHAWPSGKCYTCQIEGIKEAEQRAAEKFPYYEDPLSAPTDEEVNYYAQLVSGELAKKRERRREYACKYNASERGRARNRKMDQSPKGATRRKRYDQTEKGRARRKRYREGRAGQITELVRDIRRKRKTLDDVPMELYDKVKERLSV